MRVIIFLGVLFFYSFSLQKERVFITKTGKKYHTETCRYLRYSKIEIALEKAIELGNAPCLVCKPIKKNIYLESQSITNKPFDNAIPSQSKKRVYFEKRVNKRTGGCCY